MWKKELNTGHSFIPSITQLIDGTDTKNHHGRSTNELDANKDKGFKTC